MPPNIDTGYTQEGESPRKYYPRSILVLSGLPLSGKTTIGEELQQITNFHLLDVDETRKELPTEEKQGDEQSIMKNAYEHNHLKAIQLLQNNQPVVLVATYSSIASRETIVNIAQQLHVPLVFINLLLSPQKIQQRLEWRKVHGNSSNIQTLEHFLSVSNRFVPFTDTYGGYPVKKIDTDQDIQLSREQILSYLDTYFTPTSTMMNV